MPPSCIALLVIWVVLISQVVPVAATPPPLVAQPRPAVSVCNGKFKGGLKPSPSELAEILNKHFEWWSSSDRRANDPRTNLCDADLTYANLSHTVLDSADLNGAHLEGADLTGAHMRGAHLTSAHLRDAHLIGADLSYADVADADFDFDPNSPPKVVPGIYTAENLQLVKFSDQPAGLVKLRSEFKELGLRTQESQLTYAIRRSELNRKTVGYGYYIHGWPERTINTVLFDWTCNMACPQAGPCCW
jgi:pentapeptide repeat protein